MADITLNDDGKVQSFSFLGRKYPIGKSPDLKMLSNAIDYLESVVDSKYAEREVYNAKKRDWVRKHYGKNKKQMV